jgi:hypothetical protein
MDESQEVAPNGASNTPGTARVDLQLNDPRAGNYSLTLQMELDDIFNFMNLPGGVDNGGEQIVGNLHIHNQVRGQSGSVVWGIFAPTTTPTTTACSSTIPTEPRASPPNGAG